MRKCGTLVISAQNWYLFFYRLVVIFYTTMHGKQSTGIPNMDGICNPIVTFLILQRESKFFSHKTPPGNFYAFSINSKNI